MEKQEKGIHHISIIAGDPQANANFYVQTLGLRMVMKTVNQDDPGRYHLFYTNGQGGPGSSITFFPWQRAHRGEAGTGEAVAVGFTVPDHSRDYWNDRFEELRVTTGDSFDRFGKTVLPFLDPDGLQLELVFDEDANDLPAWENSEVPAEHGIRGFWQSTLRLTEVGPTEQLITDVFGFEKKDAAGNQTLYQTGSEIGHSLIIEKSDQPVRGQNGRSIIHHVAVRAKDEEEQRKMRRQVIDMGMRPTQVIDRHFFKSVYFHSPGGVLFEIATDGPGYDATMDQEDLGKKLFLPPWLEDRRETIEQNLPEVSV